jgi:hypothetical protein
MQKLLVITHEIGSVIIPRLLKTSDFDHIPTLEELNAINARIVPERGDVFTIDEVSPALYNAVPGTWIRSDLRPENWESGEVPEWVKRRAAGESMESICADLIPATSE